MPTTCFTHLPGSHDIWFTMSATPRECSSILSTDPLGGGFMSAASTPILHIPERAIPTYPFCKTPPAYHTHLARRLDSKTAFVIVGYVMERSHAQNLYDADSVARRVWFSSHDLQAATGKRERQVENGVEEAGPPHQKKNRSWVGQSVLEVEVDPKRPGGWWFRAVPANFTQGPPNPPRKSLQRKGLRALMNVSLPFATLKQSMQSIAQQPPPISRNPLRGMAIMARRN
jgi:hypothetical protein